MYEICAKTLFIHRYYSFIELQAKTFLEGTFMCTPRFLVCAHLMICVHVLTRTA